MIRKTKKDRPERVIAHLLERVDKTIDAVETLRQARDALVELVAGASAGKEVRP